MVRHSVLTMTLLSLLSVGPASVFAGEPASNDLKPLAFLVGTWHGMSDDGKPIHALYHLTSGQSSLQETLTPEGRPAMTTMYHADGQHVMLTHYCSLNNQPRMRAQDPKEGDRTLTFQFVDATNLKHSTDPHMHRVKFDFKDHDHFTQTWVLAKDGKEMAHTFFFERVKQEGP